MLTACPRSHAARQKKSTDCWNIFPTNRCLAHNYFSMSTPAVNISKSTLFLYNYPNDLTFPPLYIVPSIARSSIYPFKKIPCNTFFTLYAGDMMQYYFINDLIQEKCFSMNFYVKQNFSSLRQLGIEQNRCAMACQGYGAVFSIPSKIGSDRFVPE